MMRRPPGSTFFPYTTLFRSSPWVEKEVAIARQRGRSLVLIDLDGTLGGLPENHWLRTTFKPLLRSEEHTSELQSQSNLVCRLLLEKKKLYAAAVSTLFRGVQ